MNIAHLLEMAAQTAPDRVALAGDTGDWTYGDLLAAARGAGALIARSGCGHVALLDATSPAAVIALFGAAQAGVPYCPLNYRLADPDLGALLARIAPAMIIGDPQRIAALAQGGGHHTTASPAQFTQAARQSARSGADRPADRAGDPGAGIAVQLFTSGTTGAPKAAILRHANLLAYILETTPFASAAAADTALLAVPPYHIAGIATLLSAIHAQRRIVMLPDFTPGAWLRLAKRERVTHAFVVPTMLSRIIAALAPGEHRALSGLRALTYGAGRMPLELIAKALALLPHTGFTNAYGLTETSSAVTLLGPDDHRQAQAAVDPGIRARLASVGKPLATVELEIRDGQGRVLPDGQVGEIHVRGKQISGQYQDHSTLSADGWFATRDAGYRDEHGYLFLTGRADDVIVRGGENISPGEIEDVLLTNPAIADACAVALPCAEWGEAIGIAVVVRAGHPRPHAADLRQMIRRRLRSSRVPDRVLFLRELPYNEMGKLLRREVKTMMARAAER